MRSVINVPLAYYASFSVLDDREPTAYYRWKSAQLGATQSFSVLHDRELTGSVYGYDPDGDAITAQLVSGPTNGTLTLNPLTAPSPIHRTRTMSAPTVSPTLGRMV
jgi:hypothetical protein